ncbi:hypothetical protein [Brevibacillus choshinensis]|uniref:HTH araC/xylS-type domain-containing protein n=1 Tax=Brevibacillus choshinensis TaxID=54911 RepID=A0ABX7FID9_BRECH|nr:hypothetical protein [Brevibacillus choshinensis]QRG65986.1 hypothetical protein JNE38_20730 [Brevibacillus choshinensis]
MESNLWDRIKAYLETSDKELRNISSGITRIEMAIRLLEKGFDPVLTAELTQVKLAFVYSIKRIITAKNLIRKGVNLESVSEQTGFSISELEQMKDDFYHEEPKGT